MVKPFLFNQHYLARLLYPNTVKWIIPVSDNSIFLSFDDGPIPEVTLPLLDVLDHYQVKATFFSVGENVFHHPDVYQEILKRGHKTGNHTFHHLNGWKTSDNVYLNDVFLCKEQVNSVLFRPPYGKIKPSQIKILKQDYSIILWSVLSFDFDKTVSPEVCLKICSNKLKAGNIFVFHDSLKAGATMLQVIPNFIETALSQSFSFATIPDPDY